MPPCRMPPCAAHGTVSQHSKWRMTARESLSCATTAAEMRQNTSFTGRRFLRSSYTTPAMMATTSSPNAT